MGAELEHLQQSPSGASTASHFHGSLLTFQSTISVAIIENFTPRRKSTGIGSGYVSLRSIASVDLSDLDQGLPPRKLSPFHRRQNIEPMKVDIESLAKAKARLNRVFLHWRRSDGEKMAIIDQKLLVLIIKEYESRHQTLPISRSTPPRGGVGDEPLSPQANIAAGQAPRGGVAEGEQGERRPVPIETQPLPAVRKPVTRWRPRSTRSRTSSSLSQQKSGSTEESTGTGSSVSGGEEGGTDESRFKDNEQSTSHVCENPAGDQEYQFARSAAQSALTPGFFKMDESQWLDDLATALPSAGRHEIHYTNAAGYWLGLAMTAGEMSEQADRRSKDDITGLLAFSSVLTNVAAKVLATRFTYFDIVVTAGLAAGASYAASVESPEATRGLGEAGAVQCSASDLSNLFPPKHRESDL